MPIKVESSVLVIFLMSLFELLFLIPTLIYAKLRKKGLKKYLGKFFKINYKSKTNLVLGIFSISIALNMIIWAPLIITFLRNSFIFIFGPELFQQAEQNLNEFIVIIQYPSDFILLFIMNFLVIALNEELFFRGFLIDALKTRKNMRILFSSIFFSIYHLITSFNIYSFIYMFLYYFIWGLILSLIVYVSKNKLIFPIITHGLFNFLLYFC